MFAYFCFEEVPKPSLFKRLISVFKKTDYINEVKLDFINSFYIEAKIKIIKDEPDKKIIKKINKAAKQIKAYNVKAIIINKNCRFYKEIQQLGFDIYNPADFFKKNIIKILTFLSKKDSRDKKEKVCVINDKVFNNLDFSLLSKVINVCHVVGIITDNDFKAFELIDQLYEDRGIPIIYLQDLELLKKADYIILFDDSENFLNNIINKNAYIIAADPNFILNKNYANIIITGFTLKMDKLNLNIPKDISQMEILGAISEYYDTELILNFEISNIITNKSRVS